MNWSFNAYLYRYYPPEFIVNPVINGVGQHSALYHAFEFPDANNSRNSSGTLLYFINYTTPIAIGLNSSIVTLEGTIPGLGKFIQDSTTPSFSYGLAFCAIPYNNSINSPEITVSNPGEYDMVNELLPLAAPATPQLVYGASCRTGIFIKGSNIEINCNNGTINDTGQGIIIENSSNISLSDCRISGNGIEINNSTGISIYNATLSPSGSNAFGIAINDSQGVNFYNLSIRNGYNDAFSVFSSSGTPFSEAIEIHHLKMCGGENITAIRHLAFVYSSSSTCSSGLGAFISDLNLTPYDELFLLTAALSVTYLIITAKHIRRKNGKKRRKAG